MDKNIKNYYTSKYIISLIMLLIILTFSFIPLFNSQKVYAEEVVFYNFNQLVLDNNISGSFNSTSSQIEVNFLSNNYYYFSIYNNSSYNFTLMSYQTGDGTKEVLVPDVLPNDTTQVVFKTNYNANRLLFYTQNNGSYVNFNIINLTLMFGSGNEPTIEQCKNMFIATYKYTNTNIISNNDFNSYNNGYKDALNSFDYKLNTSQTYNSFESGDVIEYPTASIIGNTTPTPLIYPVYKPSNPEYILQPTYYQVNVNKYGRLRLGTEIDKGADVYIKGMVSGNYNMGLNTTSKINICILDYQNNLVVLKTIKLPSYTGNKQINYTNFEVNFTLNGNTESLYFTCDNLSTNTNNTYFYLGDIEISTKILNTSQLIENSYNTGYDTGYNNGYDVGYNNGINTKGESVWQNSMAFIKNIFVNIFDIFSIEILPNVSLGTFIIIPLIFAILFFIVKIAKGG